MNNDVFVQNEQPKESWVVGFILVFVVCILAQSCSGGAADDTELKKDDYYFACTAAEKEVKKRLKSPSSAKFPVCSEMDITNLGDIWTINSYVDADNSFGATIKTDFTVEIRLLGNDLYSVINVSVD